MANENRDGESTKAWTDAAVVAPRRHQLRVDFSERNAAVLRLVRECEHFDVQMVHLPIGDYFIDPATGAIKGVEVLVEQEDDQVAVFVTPASDIVRIGTELVMVRAGFQGRAAASGDAL